jgi:hypothetical protein
VGARHVETRPRPLPGRWRLGVQNANSRVLHNLYILCATIYSMTCVCVR